MKVILVNAGIIALLATGARAQEAASPPNVPTPAASPTAPAAPTAAETVPATPAAPTPAQPAGTTPGTSPTATEPPPAAPAAPAEPATTTNAPAEQPDQPIYQPLGGAPEKQAEEGDWDPWDHPEAFGGHDHEGFFLRLGLGLGAGTVSGDASGSDSDQVHFTGGELGVDIAVGGSVVPNLAIHLDLFLSFLLGAEASGGIYDDEHGLFDGDVNMHATGIGVTYHIMPINLYLTGAAGLGSVTWERSDGARSSTRLGLATNFLVGKEWWVDPQWGIGIAGQFMFVTADDRFYDHVTAMAFNVLFSATYN